MSGNLMNKEAISVLEEFEKKINSIDKGIMEESLEKFDFSNWDVHFYDTGSNITNKENSSTEIMPVFKDTLVNVLNERIKNLELTFMKLVVLFKTELFLKKYNEKETNEIKDKYWDIHDLAILKRSELKKLQRNATGIY